MINIDFSRVTHVYCDGGVIRRNPSPFGGTWAFALVTSDDVCLHSDSGLFLSTPSFKVTNNISEQVAIIKALEFLPEKWSGTVCSDSLVALGRTFNGWKKNNLPRNVIERLDSVLTKFNSLDYELLQGHPSREELIVGRGSRTGQRVSIHNVLCDNLCSSQAKEYLKGIVV